MPSPQPWHGRVVEVCYWRPRLRWRFQKCTFSTSFSGSRSPVYPSSVRSNETSSENRRIAVDARPVLHEGGQHNQSDVAIIEHRHLTKEHQTKPPCSHDCLAASVDVPLEDEGPDIRRQDLRYDAVIHDLELVAADSADRLDRLWIDMARCDHDGRCRQMANRRSSEAPARCRFTRD